MHLAHHMTSAPLPLLTLVPHFPSNNLNKDFDFIGKIDYIFIIEIFQNEIV